MTFGIMDIYDKYSIILFNYKNKINIC